MIIEDYVSFEIAKLLKEKGFDCTVHQYYKENGEVCNNPKSVPSWRVKSWCPCATLQMAMKWLRKEHFLFIDIDPLIGYKWSWSIWLMNDPTQKMGESLEVFSTYKEAAETAIKYCLNNLI